MKCYLNFIYYGFYGALTLKGSYSTKYISESISNMENKKSYESHVSMNVNHWCLAMNVNFWSLVVIFPICECRLCPASKWEWLNKELQWSSLNLLPKRWSIITFNSVTYNLKTTFSDSKKKHMTCYFLQILGFCPKIMYIKFCNFDFAVCFQHH